MAFEHDIEKLVLIFRRRWNIPIVDALHRAPLKGARFVVLANQLGAPRESLATSLDALVQAGIVSRNPGYGHPLRPEYILTDFGLALGPAAARYVRVASELHAAKVAYRKWSAPLVTALAHGFTRFNEIQRGLPAITPRSLTLSLRLLESEEWVVRDADSTGSSRATYRLDRGGLRIARAAEALATALR